MNSSRTRIPSNPTVPAGVEPGRYSVSEDAPRIVTAPTRRHVISYTSIDGLTHTVRSHTPDGKVLPSFAVQCLYHASVERMKGGDEANIFKAFNVDISDMEGQKLFPIPETTWERLSLLEGSINSESASASESNTSFSVGEPFYEKSE